MDQAFRQQASALGMVYEWIEVEVNCPLRKCSFRQQWLEQWIASVSIEKVLLMRCAFHRARALLEAAIKSAVTL